MAMKKVKETLEEEVAYRTPAALEARNAGKDTYLVVVSKRYAEDTERTMQVDDNPYAIIPTDETVEVAENEYFALKAAAKLRKSTNRLIEKLSHTARESGAL